MARFLGVCLAVVATLAFTPLADAWTRISPASDESTIVHLRTQKGSTLEAWYGGGYSTSVVVVRNAEHALVIGSVPDAGVAPAPLILLQQPSGTLLVYFTAVTGTFRMSSSDDGRTWTVPVRTALSADARIEGGAVLPDGTPIFAAIDDYQADPWTLAMYEGVDLERRQDADVQHAHGSPLVTPRGAVYFEYDVDGIPGGTYLQRLDATGAPVGPARRLPEQLIGLLTGDRPGNLFVVSVPGGRIRVANLRTNATWFSGRVYEVNGLTATVDTRNRLSVLWIDGATVPGVRFHSGSLRVEHRIRPVALPFGEPFDTSPVWGFVAVARTDGHFDSFVSANGEILEQRIR